MLIFLHGHQISIEEVWFPERYRTGVWRQTPGCIPLDTQWRDPTAEGVAVQGWAGQSAKRTLMDAKTKSPRGGGLTLPGEWHYAEVAVRRRCSLVLLMDLSTYLYASAHLVGETTRRQGLNLDRGSQPLDTQRIAGKREWHRETGKCSPQQGGSVSHLTSARSTLGVFRLNRAEFTISHQF